MTHCCIPGCTSHSRKHLTQKISYFAVLRSDLGKKSKKEKVYWEKLKSLVLQMRKSCFTNWTDFYKEDRINEMLHKQTAFICEKHFDNDDLKVRKSCKTLKVGAMPTKNLPKKKKIVEVSII